MYGESILCSQFCCFKEVLQHETTHNITVFFPIFSRRPEMQIKECIAPISPHNKINDQKRKKERKGLHYGESFI